MTRKSDESIALAVESAPDSNTLTDAESLRLANPTFNYLAKTGAYTIAASDWDVHKAVHISCDSTGGAFAVTLPAASTIPAGTHLTIKDAADQASANNVTITPNGTDTIDNASNLLLTANGESFTLVCDGVSNWEVV